jgi:hypothetical protein
LAVVRRERGSDLPLRQNLHIVAIKAKISTAKTPNSQREPEEKVHRTKTPNHEGIKAG